MYAVVFMDAIHYHVHSEGRIVKRAVYIALGIDMNGRKDVLSMYVGENESAKFWLSIMNGLKNRGVEDILIACVDGLNGFPQAIEAVYPKTEIQQCIIHQIRNSTKFVSYKDIKKLMADLKLVYAAPTEEIALNELELFKDKWDSKYPKIYKFWHDNWATLSTYFKYPEAVRRLIYTTYTDKKTMPIFHEIPVNKGLSAKNIGIVFITYKAALIQIPSSIAFLLIQMGWSFQ